MKFNFNAFKPGVYQKQRPAGAAQVKQTQSANDGKTGLIDDAGLRFKRIPGAGAAGSVHAGVLFSDQQNRHRLVGLDGKAAVKAGVGGFGTAVFVNDNGNGRVAQRGFRTASAGRGRGGISPAGAPSGAPPGKPSGAPSGAPSGLLPAPAGGAKPAPEPPISFRISGLVTATKNQGCWLIALVAASPARRIVSTSAAGTASSVKACVVPVFMMTSMADSADAAEAARSIRARIIPRI